MKKINELNNGRNKPLPTPINSYKKIDEKYNIDDIIDWIIKNRNIKYSDDKNKNRYIRSLKLIEEFGNNLKYVYFGFSDMTRIPKYIWDDWLKILKDKINYYSTNNSEFKNKEDNKIEYYKNIDLTKLKKGEMFDYL